MTVKTVIDCSTGAVTQPALTQAEIDAAAAAAAAQAAVDPTNATLDGNKATIQSGVNAALAILRKLRAGTVPGTSTMPAQLATVLSFCPSADTAATTVAHAIIMQRAHATVTLFLARMGIADYTGTL